MGEGREVGGEDFGGGRGEGVLLGGWGRDVVGGGGETLEGAGGGGGGWKVGSGREDNGSMVVRHGWVNKDRGLRGLGVDWVVKLEGIY